MSDSETAAAPAAPAAAPVQDAAPRIDQGYTNVVSIAMDAKRAAESSASKDDIESLRQQLEAAQAAVDEKIAMAVAAERERLADMERELKTERVMSQALAEVRPDRRDAASKMAAAIGVDVLADGAAEALAEQLRALSPEWFAPAVQQPIPSKPVEQEIDITGKTWATMTRDEIAAIKHRPDLIRQLNDAGSPLTQPRIGQIRKK